MKILTGFFMAWSNYLALPCPVKKWDDNLRGTMLAFLPSIGAVVGLLWILMLYIIGNIGMHIAFAAFLMTFYSYRVAGFFHLDGFMDCIDAIMSRRPLEDRQRILKDSRVGAFAVIAVIMLILAMYSAMLSGAIAANMLAFFIIPVVSRGVAALMVMLLKPIGHSQYAGDYKEEKKTGQKVATISQIIIYLAIALMVTVDPTQIAIAAGVTGVVTLLQGLYGKLQLGGFSGDIAGMSLVVGELGGVIILMFV